MSRNQLETCCHEAGHFVVGIALGRNVESVVFTGEGVKVNSEVESYGVPVAGVKFREEDSTVEVEVLIDVAGYVAQCAFAESTPESALRNSLGDIASLRECSKHGPEWSKNIPSHIVVTGLLFWAVPEVHAFLSTNGKSALDEVLTSFSASYNNGEVSEAEVQRLKGIVAEWKPDIERYERTLRELKEMER